MPDPLDLDQYRSFATIARVHGDHEKAGMLTILADEIERLRAIAAPLERLEAWRQDEDHSFEIWETEDDDGNTIVRVDIRGRYSNRNADGVGTLFHVALTGALDMWDRKYGKDGA